MIILEGTKYIVSRPEDGLFQDANPDNHGLPFASEAEAKTWEVAWLQKRAVATAASQDAAEKKKQLEEANKPPEPELIDVKAIDDIKFRYLVLTALGYRVKEVI